MSSSWVEKECPESVMYHGPADAKGKCPWCGQKYTSAQPAPTSYQESELSKAYGYHYDPDYTQGE